MATKVDEVDLLNQFIWAHITKDSKNSFLILYDWDIDHIGNMIDNAMWMQWYRDTNKSIEYKDISIKFLWDVVSINIPILKKSKWAISIKNI